MSGSFVRKPSLQVNSQKSSYLLSQCFSNRKFSAAFMAILSHVMPITENKRLSLELFYISVHFKSFKTRKPRRMNSPLHSLLPDLCIGVNPRLQIHCFL